MLALSTMFVFAGVALVVSVPFWVFSSSLNHPSPVLLYSAGQIFNMGTSTMALSMVFVFTGVALVAGVPFWVFIIIGGVVLLIVGSITACVVVKKRKTKRSYMEPKSEKL